MATLYKALPRPRKAVLRRIATPYSGGAMRAPESSAFEILRPGGRPEVLLICDHASNRVPGELDCLGLEAALLEGHIGWDIGAADLTRALSQRLDVPAALARFSRLVIDANRALDHAQSIPVLSDGVTVPGNADLCEAERGRRKATYFAPYHAAIDARITLAKRERSPVLVAIHSFTPEMEGFSRPWHAAVLHDDDVRLARPVLAAFARHGELVVGDNEPYTGHSDLTFTLPHHAARHGLMSVALEVRQDLIDTAVAVDSWATVLEDVLSHGLAACAAGC